MRKWNRNEKKELAYRIKGRIEKFGLVENQDYEVFHNFMENPSGMDMKENGAFRQAALALFDSCNPLP